MWGSGACAVCFRHSYHIHRHTLDEAGGDVVGYLCVGGSGGDRREVTLLVYDTVFETTSWYHI